MKHNRRILTYILFILFGVAMWILGMRGIVDEFWSGMGTALLLIGILRLIRMYRFQKDETYREQVEIATTDERNQFIRSRAWAWTGYLFILITGSSVLILKLMGQDLLSQAASWAVCLMSLLYWSTYHILKKKY